MKNVPVGGLPAAAVCSENHFFRAYGYVFGSFSTENVPVGRLPGAAVGSSIFSSGYGFDPGYGEVELLSGEKEGPWAEVLGWKKVQGADLKGASPLFPYQLLRSRSPLL